MAVAAPTPPLAERLAPYERLVKLIERELELAGQGRVHELALATAARSRYLHGLSLPAPAEAEHLLLRARALHSRLIIETQRLAEALVRRREARRMAHAMARRYVPPPRPRTYSTSA